LDLSNFLEEKVLVKHTIRLIDLPYIHQALQRNANVNAKVKRPFVNQYVFEVVLL